MIRKAIVLAAGLGTRLRPLTTLVPKPLMSVWGEPMLARIVATLRELGVEEIVINTHYLHEQVEAWAQANGCRTSYEPEILGTGGVLNPLRDWIGKDPFYLVNGDIVIEGVPGAEEWTRMAPTAVGGGALGATGGGLLGAALVSSRLGPKTIEIEPESGFVTSFHSPCPGDPGTFTYLGFAALSPKILDYVKPSGFSTIIEAYDRAMMDGFFVKGIDKPDVMWTDAGTVESYIEVNESEGENAFGDIRQLESYLKARVAPTAVGGSPLEVGGGALEVGGGALEKLTFLGARGSDRVFFRCGDEVVIIYDDAKRGENARYAGHARWLKAQGIPVPEITYDNPAEKTLAMRWGGEPQAYTLERYVKVVEALAKFNQLGEKLAPTAVGGGLLEPPFDAELYRWERELFREQCLWGIFRVGLPPAVEKELEGVAAKLLAEPVALVHRDFQSTNVLWRDGALSIIDFQGMRLGPAAYDVASLLYDPYIEIPFGERKALVKLYAKAAGRPEIVEVIPYAAIERLIQCLGAYGRLASVGQRTFLKHVPMALNRLHLLAHELGLSALSELCHALTPHHHHHHEEDER